MNGPIARHQPDAHVGRPSGVVRGIEMIGGRGKGVASFHWFTSRWAAAYGARKSAAVAAAALARLARTSSSQSGRISGTEESKSSV